MTETIYDKNGEPFEVLDERAVIQAYEAQREAEAEAWLSKMDELLDVAERAKAELSLTAKLKSS